MSYFCKKCQTAVPDDQVEDDEDPRCGECDSVLIEKKTKDEDTCWCGVESPYCADVEDGLEAACNGTGHLHCYCGGDLCSCHNHGEVQCPGCEECEEEDEDKYDDSEYDVDD